LNLYRLLLQGEVDRNFKKLIITSDQDVSLQVQCQDEAAVFTVEDKIIPKAGKSDSCLDVKRILILFGCCGFLHFEFVLGG